MSNESEFTCIKCGSTNFQRVETKVTIGEQTISGLVDMQCRDCGELRAMPNLLGRIEALTENKTTVK
ncbi:MAG: hypothetical protein V1858_01030 [Candidatus Gottesmanbacteria bacterium]